MPVHRAEAGAGSRGPEGHPEDLHPEAQAPPWTVASGALGVPATVRCCSGLAGRAARRGLKPSMARRGLARTRTGLAERQGLCEMRGLAGQPGVAQGPGTDGVAAGTGGVAARSDAAERALLPACNGGCRLDVELGGATHLRCVPNGLSGRLGLAERAGALGSERSCAWCSSAAAAVVRPWASRSSAAAAVSRPGVLPTTCESCAAMAAAASAVPASVAKGCACG
mmetsp:Transcript_19214/g.57709  ORF Transcript_19214/g.57709 Transcript_19214/m.57709 type:complete len:225 (-) Transcript_19214:173-847(-)